MTIFIFLLAGILFRALFFIHSVNCLPVGIDEAYVGLMAKHILKGEFPLVYWGTGYQGPIDSYLSAPLFIFFKLSPVSVRIVTLIWSIFFLILIFKFAKDIFGKQVGLLSLLLLAIPPGYIALAGTLTISPYNHTMLLFGTLILFLGFKLIYADLNSKQRLAYSIVLWFLCGIMFWAHMITIYYIITVLVFLFLKDKMFFLKKENIIGFIFFLIGSLPLWIYNIKNNFDSFLLANPVGFSSMIEKMKVLCSFSLPAIMGFHTPIYIDVVHFIHLPNVLGIPLLIVFVSIFLYLIVARWRGLAGLLRLSLKRSNGFEMLFVFFIISCVIFARTARANWWGLRYLEPIYSVLPIMLAYGIYNISRHSRVLGVLFTCVILSSNLYVDTSIYKLWKDKAVVQDEFDLPDTRGLIDFLQREGIKRGYAQYSVAYRLTFETDEEVIVTPPYDERFGRYRPAFLSVVESSPKAAYIFQKGLGLLPEFFEEKLKMINGEYKKILIGNFTVFYSFKSPSCGMEVEEIPNKAWKLESNYKGEDAIYAIDGNIITRWGSGAPQCPGMYFLIDMGKAYELCKIHFDLGKFTTDSPRGYKAEVSLDKKNWQTVLEVPDNVNGLFWEGEQPRLLLGDNFSAVFKPALARYIKITQLGMDPRFDWSIAEIRIFSKKII